MKSAVNYGKVIGIIVIIVLALVYFLNDSDSVYNYDVFMSYGDRILFKNGNFSMIIPEGWWISHNIDLGEIWAHGPELVYDDKYSHGNIRIYYELYDTVISLDGLKREEQMLRNQYDIYNEIDSMFPELYADTTTVYINSIITEKITSLSIPPGLRDTSFDVSLLLTLGQMRYRLSFDCYLQYKDHYERIAEDILGSFRHEPLGSRDYDTE
jgi:hypothetical protein